MRKMRMFTVKATLALVAVVMFASCEKVVPTALNKSDVLAKSVLCGHVRYAYTDDDGKVEMKNATGIQVRIESEVEIVKPDTTYKVTSVYLATTDAKGFYTMDIAVQMGKSAKCKLLTNFEQKSYVADPKKPTDLNEETCNFKATTDVELTYGEKTVKNLDAANAGVVSNPGY